MYRPNWFAQLLRTLSIHVCLSCLWPSLQWQCLHSWWQYWCYRIFYSFIQCYRYAIFTSYIRFNKQDRISQLLSHFSAIFFREVKYDRFSTFLMMFLTVAAPRPEAPPVTTAMVSWISKFSPHLFLEYIFIFHYHQNLFSRLISPLACFIVHFQLMKGFGKAFDYLFKIQLQPLQLFNSFIKFV